MYVLKHVNFFDVIINNTITLKKINYTIVYIMFDIDNEMLNLTKLLTISV